jgi:hypothetical protein
VKQDVLEIWVAVVAVCAPAIGAQINFHVAGTRRAVADLNDRILKIRPALGADKTGVKNADGFPIRSFEPVTAQALMLPNGLEQALGWYTVCITQKSCLAGRNSPVGIKIVSGRRHCGLLLRLRLSKVKLALENLNASYAGFACL